MRGIAKRHGMPVNTFRDMCYVKEIDPRTGYPKMGHLHSHNRLLSDEEEYVRFILLPSY